MNERANGASCVKPRIGRMGVLRFIRAEVTAGRAFPDPIDIAAEFDWNIASAKDALMGLAVTGHLRVLSRKASGRGWRYEYGLAE